MGQYGWLIAGIGMSALLFAVIYLGRSSQSTKSGRSRSWMSYLLLLPLVLDADAPKRKGKLFAGREWLGWAVVAFIILCGVLFNNSHA